MTLEAKGTALDSGCWGPCSLSVSTYKYWFFYSQMTPACRQRKPKIYMFCSLTVLKGLSQKTTVKWKISYPNACAEVDVVLCACHPNLGEIEAQGSRVQGQSRLHNKTLSQF